MSKGTQIIIGIFCGLLLSCGNQTPEDVLSSPDFVKWSPEQQISFDLFEGEGPPNSYSAWIGFYFIYDFRDLPDFKFNATIFLDKKKSYLGEINAMTDMKKREMFPVLFKLKFDYYEIYARKFRKYLIDHKSEFTEDSVESLQTLSGQYYQDAENGWNKIIEEIHNKDDYTEENFRNIRIIIDLDLEEYKDFGPSLNNYR